MSWWHKNDNSFLFTDVAKIPKPEAVHFETSSKTASFEVNNNYMNLIAKVELQKPDGSWDQTQQLLVAPGQYAFHEMPISESVNKLRVRFCLETDEIVCGHYSEAAIVDVRPATTRGGIDWQIPVTVVFVLAILIGLVCLACCCCKNRINSGHGSKKEAHRDR